MVGSVGAELPGPKSFLYLSMNSLHQTVIFFGGGVIGGGEAVLESKLAANRRPDEVIKTGTPILVTWPSMKATEQASFEVDKGNFPAGRPVYHHNDRSETLSRFRQEAHQVHMDVAKSLLCNASGLHWAVTCLVIFPLAHCWQSLHH